MYIHIIWTATWVWRCRCQEANCFPKAFTWADPLKVHRPGRSACLAWSHMVTTLGDLGWLGRLGISIAGRPGWKKVKVPLCESASSWTISNGDKALSKSLLAAPRWTDKHAECARLSWLMARPDINPQTSNTEAATMPRVECRWTGCWTCTWWEYLVASARFPKTLAIKTQFVNAVWIQPDPSKIPDQTHHDSSRSTKEMFSGCGPLRGSAWLQ